MNNCTDSEYLIEQVQFTPEESTDTSHSAKFNLEFTNPVKIKWCYQINNTSKDDIPAIDLGESYVEIKTDDFNCESGHTEKIISSDNKKRIGYNHEREQYIRDNGLEYNRSDQKSWIYDEERRKIITMSDEEFEKLKADNQLKETGNQVKETENVPTDKPTINIPPTAPVRRGSGYVLVKPSDWRLNPADFEVTKPVVPEEPGILTSTYQTVYSYVAPTYYNLYYGYYYPLSKKLGY
jgi:hypothetical protein